MDQIFQSSIVTAISYGKMPLTYESYQLCWGTLDRWICFPLFWPFLSYDAQSIGPQYWILCHSCVHGRPPLSTGETLLDVERELVSQQQFGVILIADNSEATNVSVVHTMRGSRTKKYCFCTRPLIVCLAGILKRHVQQSCSIIWLLRVGRPSTHLSPG